MALSQLSARLSCIRGRRVRISFSRCCNSAMTRYDGDLRARLIRLQQRLAHYTYDVQVESIV